MHVLERQVETGERDGPLSHAQIAMRGLSVPRGPAYALAVRLVVGKHQQRAIRRASPSAARSGSPSPV